MDRAPVDSSNIRSVGYDVGTNTLEVEFHGGSVYQYFKIPAALFEGLMSAGSKGSYVNRFIRKRYRFQQVR